MASRVVAPRVGLMDLPSELFNAIVEDIDIEDMAVLARTCKGVKVYIEPHLYRKIYTRVNTRQDTASLVRLLHNRPEIVPLINILVMDEYHPRHTRRLLAIRMPNLCRLLIQHDGDFIETIDDKERSMLNRRLAEQPALANGELGYLS